MSKEKVPQLWSAAHQLELERLLEHYIDRDNSGLTTCGLCYTVTSRHSCKDCVWRLHHAKFYDDVEDVPMACIDWFSDLINKYPDIPGSLTRAKRSLNEKFLELRIPMLKDAARYYRKYKGETRDIEGLEDDNFALLRQIYHLEDEIDALRDELAEKDNEIENLQYEIEVLREELEMRGGY